MKARRSRNPGGVTLELNRRDESLMAAASRAAVRSPFAIKNILVPIDFSDCSKKALQYALPLARVHGAALQLLYVLPPTYAASEAAAIDYVQLKATLNDNGEKELARFVAEEVPAEIPAETLVRMGSPAREIVEAARSLTADLIIISTHGRTGFKHLCLGSVAEHVVQRAPCPVLVVREREHEILDS